MRKPVETEGSKLGVVKPHRAVDDRSLAKGRAPFDPRLPRGGNVRVSPSTLPTMALRPSTRPVFVSWEAHA